MQESTQKCFCEGARNLEEAEIRDRLAQLRTEHRDLDIAIAALVESGGDRLRLARLKRQKLRLRDEIADLEDQLLPDIIA